MHSRANLQDDMYALPSDSTRRRAWYAFGFWMYVVMIGGGAVATGVALLLGRGSALAPVAAWLIGGGTLAAIAWRRAVAALRRFDERAEEPRYTDDVRSGNAAATNRPVPRFRQSAVATALE